MAYTSAELIAALQRRLRTSLRPDAGPGRFPPAWQAWFASMHERAGAITGATAEAIVALFVAREPAPPPRAAIALNRWRAFNTLWRQQWHPTTEDDRGVRIVAWVVTLLVHLLFAVFLIYLAYVRFMALTSAEEQARAGEGVIQVEFVGDGTPQSQGGGPSPGETPQPPVPSPAPATAAASAPPTPPTTQRTPTATPPVPREQPVPTAPPTSAVAVEQPLQVTETPAPDPTFVLPPPPPIDVPRADLPTPDLSVPSRAVRVVDVPAPIEAAQPREVAAPRVMQPDLPLRPADVAVRDIPAPLAPARVRDVPIPATASPTLSTSAPNVTRRDVPAPPGPPALPAPGRTPVAASSTGTTAAPPAPSGGQPDANAGAQPRSTASGGGRTAAPPGALPSPKRGDDWGASERNRPGGQAGTPGLFNPDGSPKLAGDGKVGGGLPPGTITEDFEKIDRHGTWLKRPPTDYTPTSFDKFWVPNETLLQEWVRKSIKEVMIPIPGTSKKIKCAVALLMLGGACGITDPNMQDVEAAARPPPDIPFKPELQEDQDSLKKK